VIDSMMILVAFKLGVEDTTNSEREISDPISEAFVFFLFLGSERLNGRSWPLKNAGANRFLGCTYLQQKN
jgi:hypothetical protein